MLVYNNVKLVLQDLVPINYIYTLIGSTQTYLNINIAVFED